MDPKGSIDLTLATKILVYDKTSNPYSMGIKTPTRIWKLQCDTESERDQWVQSLRDLLQNPLYTGYITDYYNYNKMLSQKQQKKEKEPEMNGNIVHNEEIMDDLKNGSEQIEAMKKAQEKEVRELQQRMKSLINKHNMDRGELKEEIAMQYKQQLDVQRETMLKWKEKIQELSDEIAMIEQQRKDADNEYKQKIDALEKEKNELNEINQEQKKAIDDKDDVITKIKGDVKEMGVKINKLESDAMERKNKSYAINDVLYKVQGDAVAKLKYNKMHKKNVICINKINHLFYYDADGKNKGEQKYIIVKDVEINNNSIQKQMTKPWFLIIGEKRTALFATDSSSVRDEWVSFIRKALGKQTNAEPKDDDDGKEEEP